MRRNSPITAFLCILGFLGWTENAEAAPGSAEAETPENRVEQCRKVLRKRPEDLGGHACLRQAMQRLGQYDALDAYLEKFKKQSPRKALRWFLHGRVLISSSPKEAEAYFQRCRDHVDKANWCYFGEALAVESQDRHTDALNLVQLARTGQYQIPQMAAATARLRLALGEVDRAETACGRLSKEHPKNLEVQLAHARLLMAQKKFEKARRKLNAAEKSAPDSTRPHILRALFYEKVGNREEAAKSLQSAVSFNPRNQRARRKLAKLLLLLSRSRAAIAHFTVLTDRFPEDQSLLILLGEAHLSAGSPERALGWAGAVLRGDPTFITALELRARSLIALGHIDEGLAIRPVLYQDPIQAIQRRIRIARALARKGRRGRAEAEYTSAVKNHPKSAHAWKAYADWYLRANHLSRAEAILRKGLSILPKAAELHASIAETFESQGYPTLAKKALLTATTIAPARVDLVNELARLEFMTGQHIQGIARWEALLRNYPSTDKALRNLSAAYRAIGATSKSITLLERLVARHPQDTDLHLILGELYLKHERRKEAIKLLRHASTLGPAISRIQSLLATALADTGRTKEAEKRFRAALKIDPTNRPLRLTYAHFRERSGDRPGAVRLYRKQLARDSSDADALAGLTRLIGKRAARKSAKTLRFQAGRSDQALAQLAARAPKLEKGHVGTVLRDERYVTASQRGVEQIRHVRSVLIRKKEGIKRYGEVAIAFHAQARPKVVRARTLTPDGQAIPVPDHKRRFENPHEGMPLFGDARHLVLEFQQLETGSIIDYEVVTYRPHPDLGVAWWDSYILGNGDPTVRVRYVLEQPRNASTHIIAPGLSSPRAMHLEDTERLVWERYDLPGYEVADANSSQVPAVYVSSLKDWAAVDRWYQALFGPQTQVTSPVAVKAKQIGRSVTGRVDRIAAVYRFVERNIKYLGIEFGIGAYRPRPAESTLAQGQGDCKDMTALMVALLKALDIKAYPALVRPSDQGIFVTDHPSPGQFSHVLLFVPHSRGDFWLDPTAGLGTLGAIPKILRGQLALVVDGQGGRLLRIPVATASEHELNETRVFTLNQTGGGQVDTQIALTGDLAGRSRQKLLGVDPAVRGAFLSAPGYLFGRGFIPASVELKDLDTPSEPLGISASLKDNDLVAVRLDGSLVFAPDLDILTNGLVSAPGGGVTVESPRTIIRKLIIKPPSGYRFNWSPLSIRYRGPIELYVDEKREADQTIITTRLSFSVRPTTRPELRQLKQAFAMVRQALSQHLTILPRPDLDRVKFLAAIVAERPNDPELLVHLSRALMSTQKYRAALVVLKQAERLKPNMPIVWAMMAAAHVQVGQFELAEKRLRQVIESGQAVARLHLALATLLKEQHRFADSIAVLVDAQKAFPQNAEIQKELVLAFDRNGQLGRAAEEGRRLAQAYPHDLEVQKLWGRIALAKGEFLDAETAFRLVLSVEPNDKDALNDLAWLLRDDPQRRVEAISLARRAIAIDPSLANTWDTLAEIYFLDGQMENALQAIDHAMELEPDMDRPFQKRRTKILRTFKSDDAPTTR